MKQDFDWKDGRKIMVYRLRIVQQKKLYKYKRILVNRVPFTYVPICTDFLENRYFTEEGIAYFLYSNYGYGNFMLNSWKYYSKCKKCKFSLKDYRDAKSCPRCNEKKKIWFKGFYTLAIYEIIKRGNTYVYNPMDTTNISRSRVWRRNLSRSV